MEITIGKLTYSTDDDEKRLCIKKAKNNRILVTSASIKDIEILYLSDKLSKKELPTMYFIHPCMTVSHACIDSDKNSQSVYLLYDYLLAHGAVERLMSRWKAGFAKHSLTEKVQQEKKQKKKEKQRIRTGCKEKKEEKYTCTVCGENWYASDIDYVKNIHNAAKGTTYSLNQVKDLARCPKCGSRASTHKTVKYWIDKKGNCVDREE